MEPHRSLKLLIVFLCLIISITGIRSRVAPDVSPTQGPSAGPTSEPAAVAPTLKAAAAAASKEFSLQDLAELAKAPDQSAAAEEAAALLEQIDAPTAKQAKQLVDGVDVSAALKSIGL